jgi:hypothetical protein
MRRNRFRIRIRLWLAVAVACASVAFVSSASARLYLGDNEGASTTTTPAAVVVTTPDEGFNWGDALVGAGVALAIAAGSAGIVYLARHNHRTGLAT